MPKRALLLALLMALAVILSGCLGDSGDEGGDGGDGSGGSGAGNGSGGGAGGGAGSGTGGNPSGGAQGNPGGDETPPGPGNDTAPIANLTVDLSNGTAPLTVTFSLTGADPEGAPLNWTLDADGDGADDANGTTFPADVSFTFDAAGTYRATATVTDGTHNTTANATVRVTEAPPAPIPPTREFNGVLTGLFAPATFGYVGDQGNHTFAVNTTALTNITAILSTDDTGIDVDFALYTPDHVRVGIQANYNLPVGDVYPPEEPPIYVEDPTHLGKTGEWYVRVLPGLTVQGAYTVTITFA